jgi:hypothetical protein
MQSLGNTNVFKVHTEKYLWIKCCIEKAMYGVSNSVFLDKERMPPELLAAKPGDLVFISAINHKGNALFGPFYITHPRSTVTIAKSRKSWHKINYERSPQSEMPDWIYLYEWCLFFDKRLAERISIVWDYDWKNLGVDLPPWGQVKNKDAERLIDFALSNAVDTGEWLKTHKF